jgi:hypothetical protein
MHMMSEKESWKTNSIDSELRVLPSELAFRIATKLT